MPLSRSVQSVPALSSLEHKPRHVMRRYHSLSDSLEETTHQLVEELWATPFVAVPGMGSGLRSLSRMVSAQSLQHLGDLERAPADQVNQLLPQYDSHATANLKLAVFVATISAFQVGFNTGVINVPEGVIRSGLNSMPGYYVSDLNWSIVVSIFCIGGLMGSYVGGGLADRWGRKTFLLANNAMFILGGVLEMTATNVWMLALGRLLTGAGSGAVTVVVPLYLGEIAPASLRGTLGTLYQFTMVMGILVAVLAGAPMGTATTWRWLLSVTIVPAAIQFLCMPYLTESPRWLVTQSRTEEAAEVMASLRGPTCDIDFHLNALEASTLQPFDSSILRRKQGMLSTLCANPDLRYPLAIGLGLQLAQQFSGINAVFYYSTSFFQQANVSNPWVGSVLATAVNVLATGVAVHLMDRVGRRKLLLVSSGGMVLSTVALTAGLVLQPTVTGFLSVLVGYCSVASILLFVIFFELGLGPIPWLITAEIFPSNVSAVCMTASASLNWISNFVVGISFPHIQAVLGDYTFLPFGTSCLLCFILTLLYVPETKGKSLQEIQEHFTGRKPTAGSQSRLSVFGSRRQSRSSQDFGVF